MEDKKGMDISKAAETTLDAMQKAGITKDEIRDALGYPKEYVQAMIKDFQKGEKEDKT